LGLAEEKFIFYANTACIGEVFIMGEDNMPYVVMMAVGVFGFFALVADMCSTNYYQKLKETYMPLVHNVVARADSLSNGHTITISGEYLDSIVYLNNELAKFDAQKQQGFEKNIDNDIRRKIVKIVFEAGSNSVYKDGNGLELRGGLFDDKTFSEDFEKNYCPKHRIN
jgi:hypothetical protein